MRSEDPVCGMSVENSQAAGHLQFEGETYCFCCPECQRQFDADPGRFAVPEPQRAGIPCCGFGCGMVRHIIRGGIA